MSYFDLENNKCDRCGKVFAAGDGHTNDKAGEAGYSEYSDLCQACGSDLNLGNCADCGGLLESDKIDQNFRCPGCQAAVAGLAEALSQAAMDQRALDGVCPVCGGDANWDEYPQIEGDNAIQEGHCPGCDSLFHVVYAFSSVVIDRERKG